MIRAFEFLNRRHRGPSAVCWLSVILPTLLATAYYGFFAADVYVSESRFVVRSPERQTAGGFTEFMQRVGFSRSEDDTYSAREFMLSRDALSDLDSTFNFRNLFSRERGDMFSAFPWIDGDNSFEALHLYYGKQVQIEIDTLSSISTVKVRAFDADESFRINQRLLEIGENFINQLNERGRQDLMHFASAEVETAEKKATAAALAIREFRNRRSVFDPERQSQFDLGQVSKLQDDLITTRTQLAEVTSLARNSPKIKVLRDRISSLEDEIKAAMSKVSGGGSSLSNKSAEFERLALEREFADKQLASALASLEQARNEVQRKQLYLERIAQPSKPDVAVLPKRLKSVATTFIVGLVLWGVLSMLLAGIREHQD